MINLRQQSKLLKTLHVNCGLACEYQIYIQTRHKHMQFFFDSNKVIQKLLVP
jgi:hypothetical protein